MKLGEIHCLQTVSCLTVVILGSNHYSVDVSRETIARTALENFKLDILVNLRKRCYQPRVLVVHIVAGHVDGVGVVT